MSASTVHTKTGGLRTPEGNAGRTTAHCYNRLHQCSHQKTYYWCVDAPVAKQQRDATVTTAPKTQKGKPTMTATTITRTELAHAIATAHAATQYAYGDVLDRAFDDAATMTQAVLNEIDSDVATVSVDTALDAVDAVANRYDDALRADMRERDMDRYEADHPVIAQYDTALRALEAFVETCYDLIDPEEDDPYEAYGVPHAQLHEARSGWMPY